MSVLRMAWVVMAKELVDALRDRRTLLTVLLSAVAIGPILLAVASQMNRTLEARSDDRSIYVEGLADAPALENFLARQSVAVFSPPQDYEARLRRGAWPHAVLRVPDGFGEQLASAEPARLDVLFDSGNRTSERSAAYIESLVAAYGREHRQLTLMLRGIAPQLWTPLDVQPHDLATAQTRAMQLGMLLPFFILMAVLYGALGPALDTTAGERERASLEPLLMTPVSRWALVLGKWGAVSALAMGIAVLSCLGFLPAEWWLRSETLPAMFQFGLREMLPCLALLLAYAAAMSAVLMAVAIRSRTFKEAQAGSGVLMLGMSLLPTLLIFNTNGEQPWHSWVPGLAQSVLMTRVMKGEGLDASLWLAANLGCGLLTVLSLALVARSLRGAAWR